MNPSPALTLTRPPIDRSRDHAPLRRHAGARRSPPRSSAWRATLALLRRRIENVPSAAWVLVAAAAVLIVHEWSAQRALAMLDALPSGAPNGAPTQVPTLLPLEKSAFAQAGPVAGTWPQASPIAPARVDDGLRGLDRTPASPLQSLLADGWSAAPARAARWGSALQQFEAEPVPRAAERDTGGLRRAAMATAGPETPLSTQATLRATLHASRLAVAVLALTAALVALALLQRDADARAAERLRRAELDAQRAQLERDSAERTRDLTELARHLHSVREDERARLARDLHDELGALLAAAKLTAARLAQRLDAHAGADVHGQLAELRRALDDGIRLKRRIIEDLHPSTLDHLGLPAALEIQARDFAQRAELQVRTQLEPVVLSPSAQMTAYRLVQEALTNIAKYAQARSVQVTLEPDGDAARLCVEDDGRGFDTRQARVSAHGLLGMRYRVEAEGGSLQIASSPGRGTRIAARLPAHAA